MEAIYTCWQLQRTGWFAYGLTIMLLALVLLRVPAQAQSSNKYSNWYFGDGAGTRFTGSTQQALADSKLHTQEGCASISDAGGQLLFYTDGSTIWNRNHAVMAGATGLGGSPSSSQSALIVPYQDSEARFYVFSVASEADHAGVQYAIVNMTLDSGLGGLETKNKVVVDQATEKITVVNHCNNLNHWIITHEKGNNVFRVNLLNDNGLISAPALYRVGTTHQANKGYMKPSHDGRKLAVAVSGDAQDGFLEVFDFDNKTGVIANPVKLYGSETSKAYGIEFSPDNKLLYLSTLASKKIYQINVDGLTIHTALTVQAQQGGSPGMGALQLGPDGKIYGAVPEQGYLMAITQPNLVGSASGLMDQAVYLDGKIAGAGLPFVLDDVPYLPPGLSVSLTKSNGCNKYILDSKPVNLDAAYLLYQWYVNGKAVTGANGPTLQPVKSGTYTLKVRETKCRDIQQFSNEIPVTLVEVNPTVTAIPDSCGTFRLAAHASGGSIDWAGPGIDPAFAHQDSILVAGVNGSRTYQVRVRDDTDSTCLSQKNISVNFTPPAAFELTSSTRTSCGDTLLLNANPTSDWNTFQWKLPDSSIVSGKSLVARQSGLYRITAYSTATGCKSQTTLIVTLSPIPVLRVGNQRIDTCFASGSIGSLELDAGFIEGGLYTWTKAGSVVANSQVADVHEYGIFRVSVRTPAGCFAHDSVRVESNCPPLPLMINIPDAFTPNGDGMNEKLVIFASGAEQLRLLIYNRWGEVIYTGAGGPPNPAGWETWDGTYKGQPVEGGVYSYRVEMRSAAQPDPMVRQGVVQVIR